MPALTWKVVADTPSLAQGETIEKPMPAPNVIKNRLSAAAAMPPAITAPHDTTDTSVLSIVVTAAVSIFASRKGHRFVLLTAAKRACSLGEPDSDEKYPPPHPAPPCAAVPRARFFCHVSPSGLCTSPAF